MKYFEEGDFLYALIFAGEVNGYDINTGEQLTPLETVQRITYQDPALGFNIIEVAAADRKYQINRTFH